LIISLLSLIIGSIGVMNIMLVSVSERYKEIGVRIALGAQTTDIIKQFLIETITLCSIGGIIGIILGLLISAILASFTKITAIITLSPIIFSLITISLVGIFSGLYPSYKASQIDPIKALMDK
jgi:putative ABC transport system permease protein